MAWTTPEGRLRLYFSARDAEGRARIGSAELDPTDPERPIQYSRTPAIDIGPLGAFDDRGVTSSCLVEHEGILYQYYSGWTLGRTVPFYFYVGCATSTDGGVTWTKPSAAPILERTAVDPYLTASPSILVEGGRWRMWYVSGLRWSLVGGEPRHEYLIKYAESDDGLVWERTGRACIDFEPDEYAIARPSVVRDGDTYRMWFCARGERYRICYSESTDGLDWVRREDPAGTPTRAEWDSDEQAYPLVFDHGGRRYLAYNGNGYGRTGIGLAVLAESDSRA